MKRVDLATKYLAVLGTVLVALPVIAPVVLGLISAAGGFGFRFDWLMPAELGLSAFAGALLLLWSAYRADARKALVTWGIVIALLAILGVSVASQVTGLASGATEPEGLPFVLVTSLFAVYVAALVELVVAGVLLVTDLFRHHGEAAPPALPVA